MQIAFTTQLPADGFRRLTEKVGRFLLYAPILEAEVLVSTFADPVTREKIAFHLEQVKKAEKAALAELEC